MVCKTLVDNGMFLRYAVTILTIFVVYKTMLHNPFVRKYILLILPFALSVLDIVDHVYIVLRGVKKYCNRRFYYQYTDKFCDSISYLLVCSFFELDPKVMYFALYRIVGVVLFRITKNSFWLILFFDFVKEYMVYFFLFNKNNAYLPILMFGKMCFEYLAHVVLTKKDFRDEQLDV